MQNKARNWSLLFGNVLILFSFIGFFILFYPIIQLYLFPPEIKKEQKLSKEYAIFIPKIGAYSPIVKDVNPWNESEYMLALKRGVAHARGTSTPEKNGSVYIFAHSSGNPLEVNRYNTVFYRLGELQVDDLIVIRSNNKEYKYFVFDKKEVWPDQVQYLVDAQKSTESQLILQTCTPVGTSLKRLLIFARPLT